MWQLAAAKEHSGIVSGRLSPAVASRGRWALRLRCPCARTVFARPRMSTHMSVSAVCPARVS
eukprot:491249-Prymnesium_polylepis.1